MADTVLEKGEVFLITDGEYDDYFVIGLACAKKKFDIRAVVREYLDENPAQRADHKFEGTKFVKYLLDKQFADIDRAAIKTELNLSNIQPDTFYQRNYDSDHYWDSIELWRHDD